MAAAVISCSLSFLATAAGRHCLHISPATPSPFFLRPTAATGPLSFFPPLYTCNGKSTAAYAASKRKLIEEDYLVKKVTAEELEELVKGERRVPIVLDFYATWCGPCILMAQDLEMVWFWSSHFRLGCQTKFLLIRPRLFKLALARKIPMCKVKVDILYDTSQLEQSLSLSCRLGICYQLYSPWNMRTMFCLSRLTQMMSTSLLEICRLGDCQPCTLSALTQIRMHSEQKG